jgi:hypothetical protein
MLPTRSTLLLLAVLTAASALPQNQVVPGRLVVDPPTLENLGFRWYLDADDNRNASVAVAYLKKGQTARSSSMRPSASHRRSAAVASSPLRAQSF